MLLAGQTFADYVVDAVLGRGGSATVYLAHDENDPQHTVALKILEDEHRGPLELTRLEREFDFAQRLDHPHVISVERRGDGWLSMQLLDGGTVTTLRSLDDRLAALGQIADALDYVHRCGVVHCDVKPTNILVFQPFSSGGAVLTDFGVAYAVAEEAHRRPEQLRASLPYTAPEVLRGRAPSARTDEYGLACTTVELVTGSPPFTTNTALEMVYEQLHEQPPPFSRNIAWLPRAFDGIIAKAMAKDPEVRYQTCTEFITVVSRVLTRARA